MKFDTWLMLLVGVCSQGTFTLHAGGETYYCTSFKAAELWLEKSVQNHKKMV